MVTTVSVDEVLAIAGSVSDPELPVVSLAELGIVRDVRMTPEGVEVAITPTYTGCPATEAIAGDIRDALAAAGHPGARVVVELSPAWTTDWITDSGKRKLAEHGIAPPGPVRPGPIALDLAVRCPRCGSAETKLVSRFGSTPCQALRACASCGEPFGHVKPL